MGRIVNDSLPDITRYVDITSRTAYKALHFLGKGGFAQCYKVRDEKTNENWALKIIYKKTMTDNQYDKVEREIRIHKSLDHPNIVKLKHSFEDTLNVYMVMELCSDKTLLGLISETRQGLPESDCYFYLNGIVSGVEYILSKNVIHRDIKPGNILLTSEGSRTIVKIADFGLACRIDEINSVSVSGTPNYLAPEVIARKGHSPSSEAWSIGCLLYCMAVAVPPFDSSSLQETYKKIEKGIFTFPLDVKLSNNIRNLIKGLLRVDVSSRLRVESIKCHVFMTSFNRLSNDRDDTISIHSREYDMSRIAPPPRYTSYTSSCTSYGYPKTNQIVYSQMNTNKGGIQSSHSTYAIDTTRSHYDSSSSLSISPSLPSMMFSDLDIHSITLESLIHGVRSMNHVIIDPPLHVSKWVDYQNKYGFGCLFSDGTVSVKFNSGEIVSITRDNFGIYVASSTSRPVPLQEKNSNMIRLADITRSYRQYMETQLAKAANVDDEIANRWTLINVPYITHFSKKKNAVLVMISNATTQINFTDDHVKVILSSDGTSSSIISIINTNGTLCSYRPSYHPTSPSFKTLSSDLLSLLRDSNEIMNHELFYLKSPRFHPFISRNLPLTTRC